MDINSDRNYWNTQTIEAVSRGVAGTKRTDYCYSQMQKEEKKLSDAEEEVGFSRGFCV